MSTTLCKKSLIILWVLGVSALAYLVTPTIPQAQAVLVLEQMASSSCAACDPLDFSFTVPASLPTSTVLVITVGNNGTVAPLGVTYGGRQMATSSMGTEAPGGNMQVAIYTTNNPLTGANTVSIDMNGSTNVTAGAYVFSGAAGTSSQAHVGGVGETGNGGSQTSATVDVTGTNANSIVIDNIITIADAGGFTAGAGQTERSEILATNNQANSTEAGSGTVTMSWSWVNAREWSIQAMEIQAGAAVATAVSDPPPIIWFEE